MKRPMRVIKIILVLLFVALVVASFINPVIAWVVLILLGPFIKLFLGPVLVTVALFDIVYLSFYVSLAIAAISSVFLRKFISSIPRLLAAAFGVFWLVHVPYSIYLGENHIRQMAIKKYSSAAQEVHINLGGWYKLSEGNYMGLPGHDSHTGSPHGYIYRDGRTCNWSFTKDDFVCPGR